jgi:hydroxymethylbilane synthase
MRGNVPTRLKKLETMGLDAIVLAAAGLKRLGIQDRITELLDPEIMLPAAGQGAVAVEARVRDGEVLEIVAKLEDEKARIETLTERQLLELLGGGCHAPIGALANAADGRVALSAVVASPDGSRALRAEAQGAEDDWRDVTWQVAKELKAGGAAEILEQARRGLA